MEISDLRNAKLSDASQGYLAIWIKLSDLATEMYRVTSQVYGESSADNWTKEFDDQIYKIQEEVMRHAYASISERLSSTNNHNEI